MSSRLPERAAFAEDGPQTNGVSARVLFVERVGRLECPAFVFDGLGLAVFAGNDIEALEPHLVSAPVFEPPEDDVLLPSFGHRGLQSVTGEARA